MDKKSKSKAKMKGLKPNKESSTRLDVDLWEENEDRYTTIDMPGSKALGKKGCAEVVIGGGGRGNAPVTGAAGGTLPGVVCPANASAMAKDVVSTPKASKAAQISTTPTALSIGGCASGTALVTLDAALVEAADAEAEPERGNWSGRFDFLLSLLGYSVGLGNVWRFPYLCYNNGGGAFLIPFTIMLVIAGLPLMFMELSFGQYAALGPVAVYRRFCPLFRGLGTGMILVSAIVMLYYNLIIAWTIFYMFASLGTTLPWQNCEPAWSTKRE